MDTGGLPAFLKKLDICVKSEYTYNILNGNIASKNGTVYTYGDAVWKDLLTAYNGQPITYDAQGNPTTYLGHTLAWEKGRQLKSFDNIAYTYNANGIRTSKTVNGVNHVYALDGTKILCEKWNNNTIVPLYDNEDGVCGILYNDEPFYFQKNLQGDIIGIMNKDAHSVAKYAYDAWGVCTVVSDTSDCSVAAVNPYRYRGYYYDPEIGMYYLQSRYYDPAVGRFVNGDSVEYVISERCFGRNLFAYCSNNPTIYADYSGYLPVVAIILIVIGGIIFNIALQALYRYGLQKMVVGLCRDKFAKQLVNHWIYGHGRALNIKNNKDWDRYMSENNQIYDAVNVLVKKRIYSIGYLQSKKKYRFEKEYHPFTLVKNGGGY